MSLQATTKFQYESGFTVDCELKVDGGEITSLRGPSGSGKSTLLALIAGLLNPVAGEISVAGQVLFSSRKDVNVKPWNRHVGMLFQHETLFPHLSVRKNLLFGATSTDASSPWQFDAIVGAFEIGDLLDRKPARLSGGQRDRVALGRTLLSCPQALLLDEPLSSVEESLRNEVFHFVRQGVEQSGIPSILVSHDEALIASADGPTLEIADGTLATLAD